MSTLTCLWCSPGFNLIHISSPPGEDFSSLDPAIETWRSQTGRGRDCPSGLSFVSRWEQEQPTKMCSSQHHASLEARTYFLDWGSIFNAVTNAEAGKIPLGSYHTTAAPKSKI